MSSGQASESGCYEAADAAYYYLTETLHVHPAQIVVSGWSLGAAVATDLAARKRVAGLIVLSAFTSLPEQAHAMLPWVPQSVVCLFIKERFDNLSKIRQVTCPIFIGHGTQDELVPFAMAERLAQAARQRGPVTFLPIGDVVTTSSLRSVVTRSGLRYGTLQRTCTCSLPICDVECGMRARIQRLTTEANPQQAMLEVIRLLRDINWTDSGIVEFAVLNDIEMALLPEKRVWRAFPGAELTETYSPPAVATGTSLLALFAMQEAENSW